MFTLQKWIAYRLGIKIIVSILYMYILDNLVRFQYKFVDTGMKEKKLKQISIQPWPSGLCTKH